jgi:uncharacterized protein YciI
VRTIAIAGEPIEVSGNCCRPVEILLVVVTLNKERTNLPFIVICFDKPGTLESRATMRLAHMEYVYLHQSKFLFGGPLVSDTGDARTGMVFVLDLATRAAVDEFMENEPYSIGGVFESVIVRSFLKVFPEDEPGAFADWLSAERARDNKG